MDNTERPSMVRFGLTSAVVTKYLATVHGSKSANWNYVAIMILCTCIYKIISVAKCNTTLSHSLAIVIDVYLTSH